LNNANNAFSCPFPNHQHRSKVIYICGGRLNAALIWGNNDPQRALADLAGTIPHEFGHIIVEGQGKSLTAFQEAAYCSDKTSLNANVSAEKKADLFANEITKMTLEKEKSPLGLSPQEFARHTTERLCETKGTDSHPSGRERIDTQLKTFRSDDVGAGTVACPKLPPGEQVCTLDGMKGTL
jgi:hypothetical protein